MSLPLGSLVGLNVRFPDTVYRDTRRIRCRCIDRGAQCGARGPHTAFALTEHNNAESGEHAYAHFFAMLAGGGLVFVALDAVINKK
ncbi:MAG: hypothetical protein WA970_17435 [Gammaproteobacteria bacterium]